jgi:hypothetical protein
MKKALIHLDKIVQVSDSTFEVHSSMKWVDCPDNCTTKWKYENEQFIENVYTDEEKLRDLRLARGTKLRKTDWWVLPDRTPTQEQLNYRQALRDITNTYTSLDDVIWPEKPE